MMVSLADIVAGSSNEVYVTPSSIPKLKRLLEDHIKTLPFGRRAAATGTSDIGCSGVHDETAIAVFINQISAPDWLQVC